jgi:DMSO/TMAO reductase YedYZ heme-binding membrane subunit
MRLRRYLGLSAALSHTVHFGYVCAYLVVSDEPIDWTTIVFGGAAFGLMWVMALTSNNRAQRAMGLWWQRLHLVGMHYIWLIFMQTFVGVALAASSGWAQAMSVLGFVALGVRASAWLSQRFSRTA